MGALNTVKIQVVYLLLYSSHIFFRNTHFYISKNNVCVCNSVAHSFAIGITNKDMNIL